MGEMFTAASNQSGGVGAGVGGIAGSIIQNGYNQDAAQAQGTAALEQQAQAQKAAAFATPTAAELDNLSKQINLYDTSYARSQSQIDQLSKQITDTYGQNILEQGQQLHAQLTGAQSQQVQAAQQLRDRQRSQLVSNLTSTLGPGAASTSAGQQVLNNFDFQTSQAISQVSQQSINQLLQGLTGLQGAQSTAGNSILNINGQLGGMLNSIQSTQAGFQNRQYNAQMGLANFAGADQVSRLGSDAASSAEWGQIGKGIGNILGAGGSSTATQSQGTDQMPTGLNGQQMSAGAQNAYGYFNGDTPNFGSNYGSSYGSLSSTGSNANFGGLTGSATTEGSGFSLGDVASLAE